MRDFPDLGLRNPSLAIRCRFPTLAPIFPFRTQHAAAANEPCLNTITATVRADNKPPHQPCLSLLTMRPLMELAVSQAASFNLEEAPQPSLRRWFSA